MSKIKTGIKDFMNKTFHDEVVAVAPPREFYYTYRDIGIRLESFVVTVTYKYRGRVNYFFCIDNDHLKLVSVEKAFCAARDYYLSKLQKIKSNNENTK